MKTINDVLVKHYLSMSEIPKEIKSKMSVVKSDNGHVALLNDFGIDWTYEILGEEYIEDGTGYFVTIALYLPGMVRTGVGRSNTDFNKEHKFEAITKAIGNACKTMRIGVTVNKNLNIDVNTDNGNSEDIKKDDTVKVEPTKETSGQQQNGKVQYSQAQTIRIQNFKKSFNIENSEDFMKYVTTWNKDITTKSQLTPGNIDGFLDWIDEIENTAMDM